MNDVKGLVGALIALVAAVVAYVVIPTKATPGERDLFKALIAVGVFVVLLLAPRIARLIWRRLAIARARFGAYGLLQWAEEMREAGSEDTAWERFTDQLLAAQHRYAAAIGCIAFQRVDGRLRWLAVERAFPEFPEPIVLWPGGRYRGRGSSLEDELKKQVLDETGCDVVLLAPDGSPDFGVPVRSYDPATKRPDIRNRLFEPPLFVMHQQRRQRHGVPGHVDFVFLGEVMPNQIVGNMGRWIDLDRLDRDWGESRLWPDTRECVKRAADVYCQIRPPDPPRGDLPSTSG